MPTSRQILSATTLSLLAVGCATGRHLPFEPRTGGVEPAPRPARSAWVELEPVLGAETIELSRAGSRKGYEVFRLEAPSQGDNRQPGRRLTGRYYQAPGTSRRPLVVLLPIWGASTYPQKITTRHLLDRLNGRVDVLTLDGREYLFHWRELIDADSPGEFMRHIDGSRAAYATTVADVRRILRWAAARRPVDRRRVALVGYSMSALMAVSILSLEPGLDTGVFVMAGAHMDEVMAGCPRRPARSRRNMLGLTGWSLERYRDEVGERVSPLDPLAFAPGIRPAEVFFVDAARDACMPAAGREALWEAMGRPERLTLPQNHRNAFLTMTPLSRYSTTRRVVDFLERRLLRSSSRSSAAVAAELE